jgi:hypothetical protein
VDPDGFFSRAEGLQGALSAESERIDYLGIVDLTSTNPLHLTEIGRENGIRYVIIPFPVEEGSVRMVVFDARYNSIGWVRTLALNPEPGRESWEAELEGLVFELTGR